VTATINATEVAGASMTAVPAGLTGTAVINGVTIDLQTTADTASSRAAVAAAINAKALESGVSAVDTGSDKGGVKLVAADGRNISLTLNTVTAAATGLGTAAADTVAEVSSGSITLNSDKAIAITSNLNGAATTGGIKDAGFTVGTFKSQTAYASATVATGGIESLKSFAAGDFKINGVIVGASLASSDTASYSFKTTDILPADQRDSKATSGISRATAINALTGQTGVTATVNATMVQGATSTMGLGATTGALNINGVATGAITTTASSTTAENRKATVDAINAISNRTGVVAMDSNDDTKGVVLSAADGRNITAVQVGNLTAASTGLGINMTTSTLAAGTAAAAAGGTLAGGTYTSTLTLSSAKVFTIEAGTTTAGTDALNLKVGTYGAGRSGGSLDQIDLSTSEGAVAALTTIDNAIASLSATKASIGAIQKSFMSTATDLAAQNSAIKASTDTLEQSDFISDSAELAASSLRAAASQYAFQKAIEAQGQLQGLMR
jgi:flagellin